MSIKSELEHFFKSEHKKSGFSYFSKSQVVLSHKSDTYIQGFIKGLASARVSFSSSSIENECFSVSCSCSTGSKEQFCKHIWAVLLEVQKHALDFLVNKKNIEVISKTNPKEQIYKEKQAEYRKLQYQKQKLKAKEIKLVKNYQKSQDEAPRYSAEIEKALEFFSVNGFPLERPIKEDDLNNVRKKLARIFHPDVGGSHTETVILNENYNVLIKFLRS